MLPRHAAEFDRGEGPEIVNFKIKTRSRIYARDSEPGKYPSDMLKTLMTRSGLKSA